MHKRLKLLSESVKSVFFMFVNSFAYSQLSARTPQANDCLQFTNTFCAFYLLIVSKFPEIRKPCDKHCPREIREELFCSLRPTFTTVSNEL